MTREKLLELLKALEDNPDVEARHGLADEALLEYINDEAITARFRRIALWYA